MSQEPLFVIENLHAGIEGNEILKGVDLVINRGEIHAMMGPNGSGKSTLAYAIAGHPNYEVTEGRVTYKGQNVLELGPDERAQLGMFLAFQYPTSIPGVSMANFLRLAANSVRTARAEAGEEVTPLTPRDFRRTMREKMKMLKIDESFATRYLNEGFSGGEKKRAEILQMAMLEPELCIMDETDSGLDIDALPAAHGHAADHPLPATAHVHPADIRPRDAGWQDRPLRWPGSCGRAGSGRLRLAAAGVSNRSSSGLDRTRNSPLTAERIIDNVQCRTR
jgi:Fe-S cluster assembly ATP-binding protein